MTGLSIKQIILLACYFIFCFITSLVFVQCSEKSAQERIRESSNEAEQAKAELAILQEENKKLFDVMNRSNEAVKKALEAITEAQEKNDERIQEIKHDPSSSDWLSCELPSSVRDAFKDYCTDTNNSSP